MKIVFWGKGNRGVGCLQALYDKGYSIDLVVTHPQKGTEWYDSVSESAKQLDIPTLEPEDPNAEEVEQFLNNLAPDLFILAGYGKILKPNIIGIPSLMCINLHGGKLPKYRGSSPMNWALINGEASFTLSIIRVDAGVDTGDVLLEQTFNIGINDTIRDLHRIANEQFPKMLLEVVAQIEDGSYVLTPQDNSQASYYPLRFPEDGLILWDIYTAKQIHNRIRALTEPYPCAFTYFNGRKIRLLSSELYDYGYFGEPGRVYRKSSQRGLLVCALDKCLWITAAVFFEDGTPLIEVVNRYDKLATIRDSVSTALNSGGGA